MLGWEHFAVPRLAEKVVLTARIKAYVRFIAASVVHTVAGPVLRAWMLGGRADALYATTHGWSRSPWRVDEGQPVQIGTLKEY